MDESGIKLLIKAVLSLETLVGKVIRGMQVNILICSCKAALGAREGICCFEKAKTTCSRMNCWVMGSPSA